MADERGGEDGEASARGDGDGEASIDEPRAWQRFYMGYNERFVDDCIIELANGASVRLAQAPSAKQQQQQKQRGGGGRPGGGGAAAAAAPERGSDPALTGTTVWDGAVVLAQFLTSTTALALPAGRRWPSGHARPVCIELGAGTGAVGLSLLAAGAVEACVLTDLPGMLPHLRRNLALNAALIDRPSRASVAPLRWADAADVAALPRAPPYDLVVAADCIYYSYSPATPHSRLLLAALRQLLAPGAGVCYLALSLHHNPAEVARFLAWAREGGFEVASADAQLPGEYRVPDVRVVRLRLPAGAEAGGGGGGGEAGGAGGAGGAGEEAGDAGG